MAKRSHEQTDRPVRPALPQLYSVREVSIASGMSERQIRRLVADGKLDVVRLGERRIGIPLEQVERFIKERTVKAGAIDRIAESILG